MLRGVMKSPNRSRRRSWGLRTTCLAVTGATVVVVPLFAPKYAAADPIDDQRARVEQLTDQLEALERQADVLAEDYVVAMDELRQLEEDVAAAEEAVAEQQAEVADLQDELSDVAIQAFMNAGSSGMGAIFTDSQSFNADLQRSELSRAALSTGTADSDDLERELGELADAQEELENQRDAAEEKKDEVEAAREATEEQTAEYADARQDAEAELGQLIQEEEERRARESYERMQREAEAAAEAARQAAAQQQAEQQQQANNPQPAIGGNNNNTGGGGNNTGGGGGGTARPQTPAPAPETPAAPPPASSRAGTAVNAARGQLGVPYVYATSNPGVSFDCSGLTMYAWGVAGVGLPHQSRQQYASIPHISSSQAQPGDLIFFYSPISHVGVYIGGGQMIDAPNSGSVVRVATVNWGNVTGVGRPG
jgi:cell wall-associated NlpC family hydrolase